MLKEDYVEPAATAPALPARSEVPWWRALLENRWRARLEEVTELSLAYHRAAAVTDGLDGDAAPNQAQRLLRRTVAARRKLADIEEALARLASGDFGRCEYCGVPLPVELLTAVPEARYCAPCAEPA